MKLGLTLARFGAKVKRTLSFPGKNVIMYKNFFGRERMIMENVIGALIGLLWGALIAWLNSRINRKAIAKNTPKAMLAANITRVAVDIAAIVLVYLLRNVLPGSYEATIAGTAVSLGLLTVFFAYRLSKP